MKTILTILVVLGLLATFGTMFAGVLGAGREGGGSRGNRLMQYRVALQGATLVLFTLLLLTMRG
jgi:hypothetical protein